MKNKNLAFTLVEVIVTVVIIIMLTTLSYISFSNLAGDSYNASDKQNLKEIKYLIDSYNVTNGKLPNFPNATIEGDWMYWKLDESKIDYFPSVNSFPKHPLSNEYYEYYLHKNKKFYKIEGINDSGDKFSLTNMPASER